MQNNYTVKYSPISQKDLISILDYIAQDDTDAALSEIDKIQHSIDSLKELPFKGVIPNQAQIRLKGYRLLIIGSYNVFYVPNERNQQVIIYRVLSAKQNYLDLL